MAWTRDTLEKFNRITRYDFTQLLTDFFNFNENQKQKIYDYYEGNGQADGSAFNELDRLRREVKKSITALRLNRESFNTYDGWELFSEIEDIDRKLSTIFNSGKYLRSAIATGNFSPDPLIEVTLDSQQTLERLANNLNLSDPSNSWTRLFLQNNLTEESYTSDGGVLLKVTLKGSDSLFINSVVDNIDTTEKTFGKDIQRTIEFDPVTNDLKTLSYKETLDQSVDILTTLKKGDNPEFPNTGIDSSIAVGNTLASTAFPVIFRQMYQNFATDDSFSLFSIKDVSLGDEDRINLFYEAKTKSGDAIQGIANV